MDIQQPVTLLGGLSPAQFMRRHWQRKPLLVRGAIARFTPPVRRAELFALARRDDVESRLVQQRGDTWQLRHGPFARRALPPLAQPRWTLLVQGVDLHDERVHALMQQFRFVPDARLDDLMISYATDGGGVGPHFDSYDVFLLQAHGRRRWRIGRQKDLRLREDIPLKVLAHFEPEEEFVLEAGDMLYLPPRYAHDGVAEGECMTYSIGFRAPERRELAQELLLRVAESVAEQEAPEHRYRDAGQQAVANPAAMPEELQQFARDAVTRALAQPWILERALGEYLSEPKPSVWFEPTASGLLQGGIVLDRRTRMLYDAQHVFINGESYLAAGRDAALMRRLADMRRLQAHELARASAEALELLTSWCEAGWAHVCSDEESLL
ncbi:cupin domain-containing protein [Extensimonas vulgaris]|uniref:50S ribosomal protein L16 3-hydroxylase n=1 Tax=Extensimonas vulgaris TaxID=1031594 RepID=A0A369AJB8_9BURK|nr:cupin domain-containing protein [Extensimonas vulgaris]RCX09460.1 50S ribosomal protein L16 3-hydroxylase [Extensimonas vulgaris]TWI38590.1 50S ribosomal protein L16 3-hydroxylase [Extensimonas vulgaris]TXD14603.1 cupin domain-containing protein [Extensimonas vulgaris]